MNLTYQLIKLKKIIISVFNLKNISITVIFVILIILFQKYYRTNSIPNFLYYEIQTGAKFSRANITTNNKAHLFIHLSTSCDDCHFILQKIQKTFNEKSHVKKFNIYIVFDKMIKIDATVLNEFQNNNVYILFDKNKNFTNDFSLGLVTTYPYFVIYDSSRNYKESTDLCPQL